MEVRNYSFVGIGRSWQRRATFGAAGGVPSASAVHDCAVNPESQEGFDEGPSWPGKYGPLVGTGEAAAGLPADQRCCHSGRVNARILALTICAVMDAQREHLTVDTRGSATLEKHPEPGDKGRVMEIRYIART